MSHQYEHLASFLASWFHQDFDLVGNTAEEIASVYKKTTNESEVKKVAEEIGMFLDEHRETLDEKFEELFDIDVDPTGFAPSIELFLVAIRRILSETS
jgi:dsDNA-binding SOS-regulon protein